MLAYVFWHAPAAGVAQASYEAALERFHRSLAHRPPSGFAGSASFRVGAPPWADAATPPAPAYEDWYLLEGWSAVGVLEEAAVSRGHVSAHEDLAAHSRLGVGGMYRLIEGHPRLAGVRLSVWVTPGSRHEPPPLAALLGDGMDRASAGLWRRSIALGPAPEYCMLAPEVPAGVAGTRMPDGWSATTVQKEELYGG